MKTLEAPPIRTCATVTGQIQLRGGRLDVQGKSFQIESGTVWVNKHMALTPTVPFSGAKQSGLGAELGQEASVLELKLEQVQVGAQAEPTEHEGRWLKGQEVKVQ